MISDVVQSALDATPRGHALALAWTALAEDDASLAAFMKLGRATNWNQFVEATRSLHAPQQNLSYADVDGNIGFIAPGRIPVRKRENRLLGLAPAPGWDARYDWAGFVPFDELPRAFNPPSGKLVTANHKIVPSRYRHHITSEWDAPYRARRIDELLDAALTHDRASFARMQADVVSLAARELLPRMVAIQGKSIEADEVLKWLAAWDGAMSPERPEPRRRGHDEVLKGNADVMISEAVETLVDTPDGVPRNPVIGQTLVAMCSWTSAPTEGGKASISPR